MAIVRSIRRISPLDVNKNVVTIGVALPLSPTNIFQGTPTTREQVKTNLLNLILTEKGERINHPNYGLGVKSLLFEQNLNMDQIELEIHKQIQFYLPEINLLNTEISTSEDQHTIQIKITYNIISGGGIPDAIAININDPFEAYREDEAFFQEGRNTFGGHTSATEHGGDLAGLNPGISYNNTTPINFV
jgi:phage baseplate assembly protein W